MNPINYIQNETITEASERLINSEKILLKSFKTLMQRHHVRLIPITKVYFTHGTKSNVYYIYGKEMKIYAPNFPKSTCVIMWNMINRKSKWFYIFKYFKFRFLKVLIFIHSINSVDLIWDLKSNSICLNWIQNDLKSIFLF